MWKKIAMLVLLLSLGFSYYQEHQAVAELQRYYPQLMPEAQQFEPLTPTTAVALDEFGQQLGYVGVAQKMGYGGPVLVGLTIDLAGNLQQPVLLESRETPNYIDDMEDAGFFSQFAGKSVHDSLRYRQGIQGVSGATLSTRAISVAAEQIAHAVGAAAFGYVPVESKGGWQISIKEIAVALLFAAGIICGMQPSLKRLRPVCLGISIIVLGFWLNRSLSMAQISSAFLGYFPQIDTNLIWYLVLAGVLLPPLLAGKNLYCSWLCPFCGLQEGVHLITRQNWPMGRSAIALRHLKEVILFVVLLTAFLLKNPNVSSFEPFGTVFGLSGTTLAWCLVGLLFIAAAFYKRFWCRTLCPVGTFLDDVTRARNAVIHKLKSNRKTSQPAGQAAVERQPLDTAAEQLQAGDAEKYRQPEQPTKHSEKLALVLYFILVLVIVLLTISKYMNMILTG